MSQVNIFPILFFSNITVYLALLEPFGIGPNDSAAGTRRKGAKPTPIAVTAMVGPKELWPEYLSNVSKRFVFNTNSLVKEEFEAEVGDFGAII